MPPEALAIVLAAAALHAFWNLVIARAEDTQATTAVALGVGVAVALPFAAARWDIRPEAVPFVALSSALELLYFWLLTTAYRRAEMSLVYPIARGLAPVIVLVVSVVLLNATTSLAQVTGVGLIGLGVLLVRGLRGAARTSDIALAMAVAASIAAYTLVDQQGVRHADPVAYLTAILVMPAIASMVAVERRGPRGRLRRALTIWSVAGGVASIAAYGSVLVALTMAPVAPVAAVREVSVVIAAGLAAVVLREEVGRARLAGSVVVVAGVVLTVVR